MKLKHFVICAVCLVVIVSSQLVFAQLDSSLSYCFRFTWLGPEYDNTSTSLNISCSEYLDEIRAENVPCRTPYVITYDATPPDIDYLWENYDTQIVCRRARGSVCAKYSYSFNNELQNITYMCTQAYAVGEGAVTRGCYTQTIDGYDMEVCLCESAAGYKPCNSATSISSTSTIIFTSITVLYYVFMMYR